VTPEETIVALTRRRLGAAPVLLCGSRALQAHHSASDFDVVVVLPLHRIPLAVRRLRSIAQTLAAELGVPVSINPFPARALLRRENLFAWKLRREGRVLAAPDGFELNRADVPRLTPLAEFSYLMTAALYLLEGIDAGLPARPTARARAAEKALLHVAQLRLLREGQYESRLDDALRLLAHADLERASVATLSEEGWLRARTIVVEEIRALPPLPTTRLQVVAANARYVAIAALRGRMRLGSIFGWERVDARLAGRALELLRTADPACDPTAEWSSSRDALVREWPDAHPLSAL
jgi:predicted nucleotidyltransferase